MPLILCLLLMFTPLTAVLAASTYPGGVARLDLGAQSGSAPHARYQGQRVLVHAQQGRWQALLGVPLESSTGWSTGPHLHLEVRVDGLPKDPLIFLP